MTLRPARLASWLISLSLACTLSAQTPTASFHEQEIKHGGDFWYISVKYPQIEGEVGFNRAVRQSATEQAETFRKQMEFFAADKDRPSGDGYMEGSYTATVLSNGIISVLFDYGENTPGAVHPWGVMESVNYDTHKQRVLALADLFRPGSDYVAPLSKLAIASLKKQMAYSEEEAIRSGAGPVASNFKVFTLTNTELVLHFQQYQVAPGVDPGKQVAIPLTRLAPLLRQEYRPAK